MGVLKKLAKGEYSLRHTFWGGGWLIDFVFLNILLGHLLRNIYHPITIWSFVLLVIFTVKLLLSIIICMGIYSIIKKNGKTFWSVIAFITQIVFFIFTLNFAVEYGPLILKIFISF